MPRDPILIKFESDHKWNIPLKGGSIGKELWLVNRTGQNIHLRLRHDHNNQVKEIEIVTNG